MNDFLPGFFTGAISTLCLVLVAACINLASTGSSVTATGYQQHRMRKVYVGDDLWVSDFAYNVSPSSALVTVTFVPKNKVRASTNSEGSDE